MLILLIMHFSEIPHKYAKGKINELDKNNFEGDMLGDVLECDKPKNYLLAY